MRRYDTARGLENGGYVFAASEAVGGIMMKNVCVKFIKNILIFYCQARMYVI